MFLIVQLLTVLGTRKVVLDQSSKKLLETINSENKIYTNEELSTIISDLEKKVADLSAVTTELRTRFDALPIGEYTLFSGNYTTTSTSYKQFFRAYAPFLRVKNKFNSKQKDKYKFCVEHTTDARESTYASIRFRNAKDSSKYLEFKSNLWGEPTDTASADICIDVDSDIIVRDNHYLLEAKVDSPYTLIIHRIYLLVY